MTTNPTITAAESIQIERKKLKRELTLLPLFGMIYFTVCGGAFGSEAIVGWSGPGMALILLAVTPILFSIPNMLMVRELSSMMPAEGGYYHWVKQGLGPFWGFLTGWMNLVVSWVDVSIYPVLAAYYLGYFLPALREGAVLGGIYLSGDLLSWFVALVLIWLITALQIRGTRLTALTTDWVAIVMLLPLLAMSVFGIINWVSSGVTIELPLLPEGETLFGAFSVGLFVAMWNYMGWELPTSAGDEIVNPRRTYPLAMVLTLVAAIATYAIPMLSGLYGGAGIDGRHQLWGIEEYQPGEGIGSVLTDYGVPKDKITSWGVDTTSSIGWEYPDIAHQIGATFAGVDGKFARFLGLIVTISAIFSMTGLFIGNSLSASRVPFAMAADGMMPLFLVKVHPRYGTPYVAIIVASVLFSMLSLSTFAFLVVVDVFLNMMALVLQFFALWALRFKKPNLAREKVPGGWIGLVLATLAPFFIIGLAIVSQISEEGLNSIWFGLIAIVVGALLYFLAKKCLKPGIPDVDPFVESKG
ncbi:MAG: APC family permease [Anaerolineae bacterium]|nr:APC family permease [Anaerolineae bacterium]